MTWNVAATIMTMTQNNQMLRWQQQLCLRKTGEKHLYLTKAKNVYNSVSSRHLLYVLSIPFRDGVFPMWNILTFTWAWTKMFSSLSFSEKLEAENVQKRQKEIILTLKYDHDTARQSPWCWVRGKGVIKSSGYHFPVMYFFVCLFVCFVVVVCFLACHYFINCLSEAISFLIVRSQMATGRY